jgi:hypothetical protein
MARAIDFDHDHPLLPAIRAGRFQERCGAGEYRDLCGGFRAGADVPCGATAHV